MWEQRKDRFKRKGRLYKVTVQHGLCHCDDCNYARDTGLPLPHDKVMFGVSMFMADLGGSVNAFLWFPVQEVLNDKQWCGW